MGRGDWRTPTGGFHIATKEPDPSWEVPKSIQEEMRRNGKPVITSVPAGPDNPLGKYWLGFDRSGVGIHGTNSPNSIYRSATHGCIRMRAESIEELFGKVEVNTAVNVIYQPVLLGIDGDGIYLEAHPDVYKKGGDPVAVVRRLVTEAGVQDRIVWETVKHVLAKREGIARRIDVGTVSDAKSPASGG
ncbi:MAG TPA: L,D-transpeptidase [Vicinamibacterales bacterium]|nr:L,D-transpeptidase [Vicinamibacterales bacterium]